jgi:hypothetical protein
LTAQILILAGYGLSWHNEPGEQRRDGCSLDSNVMLCYFHIFHTCTHYILYQVIHKLIGGGALSDIIMLCWLANALPVHVSGTSLNWLWCQTLETMEIVRNKEVFQANQCIILLPFHSLEVYEWHQNRPSLVAQYFHASLSYLIVLQKSLCTN